MKKLFIVLFLMVFMLAGCKKAGNGGVSPNNPVLEFQTMDDLKKCIETGKNKKEGAYEIQVWVEEFPELERIKETGEIPILLNIDRETEVTPHDDWFFSIYGRPIYREWDKAIGITYKGMLYGKKVLVDIMYATEGISIDEIDFQKYYLYADNYRRYGETYDEQKITIQTEDRELEVVKGIDTWVGRYIMFMYDEYCVRIFTFASEMTDEEISQLKVGYVGLPVFPKVYSNNEEFYVYGEVAKQQINKLAEKYVVPDIKTGEATIFSLAYYEIYDLTDTRLPVVLGISADEAQAKYGEEWLELVADSNFNGDKNVDAWCYGVLTAQQISDLLMDERSIYVYLAADDTVSRETVNRVDIKSFAGIDSIDQLKIYAMRKEGDVEIYEKAGEYRVTASMHSAWELY